MTGRDDTRQSLAPSPSTRTDEPAGPAEPTVNGHSDRAQHLSEDHVVREPENADREPETAARENAARETADPETADPQPADPETTADEQMVQVRLRVRRAPNFARFIIVGFVIGVLVGGLVDLLGPLLWGVPPVPGFNVETGGGVQYGMAAGTAFLAAVCGLVGGLVGAIVAVVLDRRS